ncbi:galactokinase [Candidatus Woesearchaeota archaeon]|nr:galactokinase [Candidatus Woesearchaeota archaeon]
MTGVIITRTPLRISLGGGGTDLKSYYEKREGFWISAAINQYIYVTLHRTFTDGIIVKYSKMEKVDRVTEIQNDLVREALKLQNLTTKVEITSIANLPAKTGLGSSGTFGVGLLKAIYASNKLPVTQQQLAEDAVNIEVDILKRPVGKQDQYIAAFGGITCFEVDKKGNVTVSPLRIGQQTLAELEDHLLLFFTGFSRDASSILKEQHVKSKKSDTDMLKNLDFVKKLGLQSKEALETGDLKKFGEIMHEHWLHKKKRSGKMTNPEIDKWYNKAMNNGAIGGKLVGAGGGGFLMFYADNPRKLRTAMREERLHEIRFKFDFEGAKVILNE